MLQTITWTGSSARLLDQTQLPTQTVYVDITDEKQMWDAIRRLVIRGIRPSASPPRSALISASECLRRSQCRPLLASDEVCDYLATSRPTAVNLFWALDRIRNASPTNNPTPPSIKQSLLDECPKDARRGQPRLPLHRRTTAAVSSDPPQIPQRQTIHPHPHPLQRRRPRHRPLRHRPRPHLRRRGARPVIPRLCR